LSADSLRILNPGLRIANGNKNGEQQALRRKLLILLVEQRGIEPLTSALRMAKKRFLWTTFSALKIAIFRQKP